MAEAGSGRRGRTVQLIDLAMFAVPKRMLAARALTGESIWAGEGGAGRSMRMCATNGSTARRVISTLR